jgi:hypothetical protein
VPCSQRAWARAWIHQRKGLSLRRWIPRGWVLGCYWNLEDEPETRFLGISIIDGGTRYRRLGVYLNRHDVIERDRCALRGIIMLTSGCADDRPFSLQSWSRPYRWAA